MWPDCFTRTWHMSVVAGGGNVEYEGAIFSDMPFDLGRTIEFKSSDLFQDDGNQLEFRVAVRNNAHKRIDFAPTVDGRLYLDISDSMGGGVFLGRSRAPVSEFPIRLGQGGKRYNIVVIYSDDQRADTIWAMPELKKLFVDEGVKFTKAFDGTAFCCPSRASFLSGGLLSKNTGVLTNQMPNGGFSRFNDTETLATRLQKAGYRTLYVGKYMNGYEPGYVPPGWTQFFANNDGPGNTDWNSYSMTVGSSTPNASSLGQIDGPIAQYVTDYHRDLILDFVSQESNQPFFVLFSPLAPHAPGTPAPGDEILFQDFEHQVMEETDLSDKPAWISDPTQQPNDKRPRPTLPAQQLRSLQALDRATEAIVAELNALGLEDDTVVIYASDDGFVWGEHGLWSKGHQYEESIRVPFLIRFPDVAPRFETALTVPDIDIPASVFDLANATANSDGLSVLPLLLRPAIPFRDYVPLARYEDTVWAGVRTNRWKYILSATGEEELYDLDNDPLEFESLHADPAHAVTRVSLRAIVENERGLAAVSLPRQKVVIGEPVAIQLEAWGGQPPYNWTVESDPPNIFLGRDKQVITELDLPLTLERSAATCGRPNIEPGAESGVFLWHDCGTEWWRFRVSPGGDNEKIAGVIKSNRPFDEVRGNRIGVNDRIDVSLPWRLLFNIDVWGENLNGVNFLPAAGSTMRFDVDTGELPDGLFLEADTGVISGTPLDWGFRTVRVRVHDSSQRKIDGQPQDFGTDVAIKVNTP